MSYQKRNEVVVDTPEVSGYLIKHNGDVANGKNRQDKSCII